LAENANIQAPRAPTSNNSDQHMTGNHPGGSAMLSAQSFTFIDNLAELQTGIAKLALLVRAQHCAIAVPKPAPGPASERWNITQRLASEAVQEALLAVENSFDNIRAQARGISRAIH